MKELSKQSGAEIRRECESCRKDVGEAEIRVRLVFDNITV